MMYIQHISSLFLMLSSLVTPSTALPASLSIPIPPTEDPWYTTPDGLDSACPGDVLRIRSAPGNLTSIFSNSSAAYNILYRTTDSHQLPSWAVTTLFVPKGTENGALLSYQIPYDSANLDASPSYSLYGPITPLTSIMYSDIQTALSIGLWVNVPDFEGPLASFTNGVQSGYATLDSVRAVMRAGCGLAEDATYAMWGYSGGSFGSEWAAELQPQYAPELSFAGAALGGLVTNLSSVVPAVTGTQWAALIPEAIVGITNQFPAAYEYLLSQLKTEGPFNKSGFLVVKDVSIEEAFPIFAKQNIYEYFQKGEAFFDTPIIQTLIHEGHMGFHGVPEMPLFIYKAIADEITSVDDTDWLVEKYCSIGARILYERNTIGGHLAEMTNGDQRALQWLKMVLDGRYDHQGCTIRNVSVNVTDTPL